MEEDILNLALKWDTLFAAASELIDDGDYAGAMPVLKAALSKIEALDAASNEERTDRRIGDTLERIAYIHQQQGDLAQAEPLYRRALEIAELYMLSGELKARAARNLAKLLTDTGRAEESEALQNRYRIVLDADVYLAPHAAPPVRSPECQLMHTLNSLSYSAKEKVPTVLSMMADLLDHIEVTFGTASNEFAEWAERIASNYLNYSDMQRARPFFEKVLLSKLASGASDEVISKLCCDARQCDQNNPVYKALAPMFKRTAADANPVVLADMIRKKMAEAKGETFTPSSSNQAEEKMDPRLAAKIVQDWKKSHQSQIKPAASTSPEQRFAQMKPLAEKALEFSQRMLVKTKELEEKSLHPLGTICMLSTVAELHEVLGDNEQAKRFSQIHMEIVARHWGEGHPMMVDAHKEYARLCSKK